MLSTAELEAVMLFLGFLGLGTFTLIGLKMFLTHRAKRFLGGGQDVQQLGSDLRTLRDEVQLLRGDLTDLAERVDFTERVLAQTRDAEDRRIPGGGG